MDSFQALVLNYTSRIIQKLHSGTTQPETYPLSEIRLLEPALPPAGASEGPCFYDMDVSAAETLLEGVRLGQDSSDELATWHVMAETTSYSFDGAKAFQRVGLLPAGLSNEGFVFDMYLLFLGRPADGDGWPSYTKQLDSGAMSRRDVMRTILTSEEGRRRNKDRALLVMAERPLQAARRPVAKDEIKQGQVILVDEG